MDSKKSSQNKQMNHKQLDNLLKDATSIDDIFSAFKEYAKPAMETLLEAELTEELGYEPNDRKRKQRGSNSRNGYSKKHLKTDDGLVQIDVPRDRKGEFEPKALGKYETIPNKTQEKIISMYAKGMTTRDISRHLKDLYGVEISSTGISNITSKVLDSAKAWQARHLERVYPIVYLDAMHNKVHSDGQIRSKAAYQVVAYDLDGVKDVLGIYIGEAESATFWLSVLTDLQNRGVEDILIVCKDGLKGFDEAIESIFPKAMIQSCVIHQIRNSLKYVASKYQKEFSKDLKGIYQADTIAEAEKAMDHLEEKWGERYPVVINSWRKHWPQLTAYFQFTKPIRKIIYTTNIVEGYHRQLRKVSKNRGVFDSDDALFKLLYLATKDLKQKWTKPRQNWSETIGQLSIYFEGRVPMTI